jgi:hypothetical protein
MSDKKKTVLSLVQSDIVPERAYSGEEVIAILESWKPTQQEQIEEAVKHGKSFGQHMTPTDYFTNTYGK